MGAAKLTKRTVEGLLIGDTDKFWWDTELRGFGVKVTRAGTKIFLIQYRMGGRGTKTRRYTIGKLGSPWDVPRARSEAERLLRLVGSGKDPQSAERARKRDEVELAFPAYVERFLGSYGRTHWRTKTFKTRAADLRNWVVPPLKAKSLPSITRTDLSVVFAALPQGKLALPRNVFAVANKLFAWAVSQGDLERSPCEGMKRPKAVRSRERVLDNEELMWVAALAPFLSEPFSSFVELLLVTGQRRDEVAGMSWGELSRGKRQWTIPQQRTKNSHTHHLPLGRIAVASLDRMAGGKLWPSKGYVFTTTGKTPISGFSRMKRRLDDLIARVSEHREIAPWRLHDLRRTMATNLQQLGVRFEVTEALLNHRESRSGIAGVYQMYDWKVEKREAVDMWDDRLGALAAKLQKRVVSALAENSTRPRIAHVIKDGRAVPAPLPPLPRSISSRLSGSPT